MRVFEALGTAIAKAEISFATEALGFAGCASIAYGAWTIYRPAGFIVGGVLAVAIATVRGMLMK